MFPLKLIQLHLEDEEILSVNLLENGVVRWRTDIPPDEFENKLKMWIALRGEEDE